MNSVRPYSDRAIRPGEARYLPGKEYGLGMRNDDAAPAQQRIEEPGPARRRSCQARLNALKMRISGEAISRRFCATPYGFP